MSKEINILLFGQTGAGKSTTLNALANYFRCSTFTEALETIEQLSEVIPSQFTLPHPETGESVTIRSNCVDANASANECSEVGASATIHPNGYLFPFGGNVLRIIDTPGIGDTAGTEQDRRNFEGILTYLQMLKSLHGIIFIVNGTDKRKTTFFQYCITQLMTYLHKSVVQNIVFCFTYSQITPGTFGPGDGFDVLKAFFEKEISEVGIRLEKGRNAFFIENDAYRLLVAKKQGYEWKPIQKMLCEESWNYSVKQCVAMFTTIQTFTPHDLDDTISLNNAKKVISELVEPIIRLTQNIEKNIAKIEKNKEKLNRASTTREDLKELVEMEVEDLEKQSTDIPKMVCTNSNCPENVFRGHEKASYSTVCCKPCNCYHFVDTFLDDISKTFCSAMAFKLFEFSFVCLRCTCKTSDHEAICYEYVKIKRKVVNENAKKLLSETNDMIEQKKRLLKNFNDQVQNMERELETIENIGAQFDYFLAANSLFSEKNYFQNCVTKLISQETLKENYANIDSLFLLRKKHNEKVNNLKTKISNGQERPITTSDILSAQKKLLTLNLNGTFFGKVLKTNEKMRDQYKQREKRVNTAPISKNVFAQLFSKIIFNSAKNALPWK